MMTEAFEVVVIGAGSGGRSVAGRLADCGVRVAMVESELVGGECPYWACMPSKALLRAPEVVGAARRVPGVTAAIDDRDEVFAFREEVVSGRDDTEKAAKYAARGVTVVRGKARLAGAGRVDVGGRMLRAERIVLATGSTSVIPPVEGLADVPYWTNREAMEMRRVPASALVLGGGPVGVEIAQLLSRLGSRVTIADSADRLLAGEAPEVGDLLGRAFAADGIELVLGTQATRVTTDGAGVVVRLDDGSERAVERIVIAVGRRPRVADLGLETVGIEPGDDGIRIDERCRAAAGVWALGDVTTAPAFTHVASYQGRIVCGDILGEPVEADYTAVPRSVFCDPEVSAVGLTEQQAREAGIDVAVAGVDLGHLERASTYGRNVGGRVVVVADRRAGVLVGAHAIGPLASEWMSMAVLAIRAKVPVTLLRELIIQFPTFSEGLVSAVRELEL